MKYKNNPPRVAAVHDLSCFGRCALTVVTPILSVMGAQVVPLPTALLSTHTGGFEGFYFRDLSEDMRGIIAHFESLGLCFDAIYSGFLGNAEQVEILSGFIDKFGDGITVLIDPVMGDDGVLYKTCDEKLIEGMKMLCRRAEILTPNLTEACVLTGESAVLTGEMHCSESLTDRGAALELSSRLCSRLWEQFGEKKVVITGIKFTEPADGGSTDMIGNAYIEPGERCRIIAAPRAPRSFPGTGEVFASVLLGCILRGQSFGEAVRRATEFTCGVIQSSQGADIPAREGVLLEGALGRLANGD